MALSKPIQQPKPAKKANHRYPRAPPQPGLTAAHVKDGQWRVETLVDKRFLDDTLQYLVRWEGPFDGPPGSYEAKEKWEDRDDVGQFLIQRYENDAFRAAWPGPVPEVPRVTTQAVESEENSEEEESEAESESESESESGSEYEPESEDEDSDAESGF
jgi:hypothetical protein